MKKICLVAVDIRSSHNVGSLFRTADGFSADIILTGICPRPIGDMNDDRLPHVAQKAHKDISKTSLGAESKVSWKYYTTSAEALRQLKNEGYKIVAIEQHPNAVSIEQMHFSTPVALVMGAEVEGLPNSVLDLCDEVYEIPMYGSKESFNVSVAAGIALYQARSKIS
jgi:23S rRNA (guanosine2251-2'-O)-methyltransferase